MSPGSPGRDARESLGLGRALSAIALASAALVAGPSARAQTVGGQSAEVWRDLLAESSRAELDSGGPLIDFGTADQHKYTRGGWHSGWGPSKRARDGVTHAPLATGRAWLHLAATRPVRALVARVRNRTGTARTLTASVNGTRLAATATLTEQWRVIRLPVANPTTGPTTGPAADEQRIELRATPAGPGVDIDWLWASTAPGAPVPSSGPRVAPLRLGGRPLRALVSPGSRTYSFYLHVPERAQLSFHYGASASTRFTVRAQMTDGSSKVLLQAQARPDRWTSTTIDLSAYAGRALRLQLATEGTSMRAGWGRLELQTLPVGSRPRSARARTARPRPPRNLVLVVHDTTRADVFGPFARPGQPVVATPHFDALATGGTVFMRAYNNESWTRPSTITLLTGLYPESHGALYARSVLDSRVVTLAEHLQKHGFQTFGIVGNGVLGQRFGLDQGWDEYLDRGGQDNRARRIFGEASAWVRRHHQRGRFFVYIQSHDSHTPYEVDRRFSRPYHRRPYRGHLGAEVTGEELAAMSQGKRPMRAADLAWLRALYRGEATYQDSYLGQFLSDLERWGVLDDTLVVITNDHGEELFDHGGLGHAHTLREELLRAPLIMRHPTTLAAGRRVEEVVEHVDIAPTAVDALGLPPMARTDGLSLMPLLNARGLRPRPYYAVAAKRDAERAIVVGRWKLVVEARSGRQSLFDLTADPGETRNRLADRPLAARLCEVYLGEALASPAKAQRLHDLATRRRYHASRARLDARARAALEALGYLGDSAGLTEVEAGEP